MTNVWCVRTEFGTYTTQFAKGRWGEIPPEFRERLGLKPGLVRV